MIKRLLIILLLFPTACYAQTGKKYLEWTENVTVSSDDVLLRYDRGDVATYRFNISDLLTDQLIPDTLTIDHATTAGTADALTTNGINCNPGFYPLGVNQLGAVEDCTAVGSGGGGGLSATDLDTSTEIGNILSDETGTGLVVFSTSPVLTTPNIGSATGSITGNAGTANALAANGTNCAPGKYAQGVNAAGDAEGCTADVSGGGGGGGGTECSTSPCDLDTATTLNNKTICLADGTGCPAIAAAGGWTDGGTNVYTSTGDKVGIGTTAPSTDVKLEVSGTINQLTSCPSNILTFFAGLPDNSSVKFPAGCSYNLTTTSVVTITKGVVADFNGTTITRSAAPASGTSGGMVNVSMSDPTKKVYLKNLNLTGAFVSYGIYVNQQPYAVGQRDNLIFENIKLDFTSDIANVNAIYGFRFEDSGYTILNSRANIISVGANSVFTVYDAKRATAEAHTDFLINGWYGYANCLSTTDFCRGLDLAYQNDAALSASTVAGVVTNFYSFGDVSGSTGNGCKQTNDTVVGTDVNVVYWSNGTCSGSNEDFRDASANGQEIHAILNNVNMANGKFAFKSQANIEAKGVTWKNGNVWFIGKSMTNDANADQEIEAFIGQDFVLTGDTVILPPGDIPPDTNINVTKAIHIRGMGMDSCATKVAPTFGSGDDIFRFSLENSSLSDLCIGVPSGWTGIKVDCTAGVSCTNVDISNVKIINSGSTGSRTGINYLDASGDLDNVYIDLTASGASTLTGLTVDQAATDTTANKVFTIRNSFFRTNSTGGTSNAIKILDSGTTEDTNAYIYDTYAIADETTSGTSTAVQADGNNAKAYLYNSYVSAVDTALLQANSATLTTNNTYNPQGSTSGTVTVNSASGGWTDGGTSVALTTSTDSVALGTTAAVGKLDVRGDEARVWTGAGSDNNALSSGELYVEGDLEADGTIYGSAVQAGSLSGASIYTAAAGIDFDPDNDAVYEAFLGTSGNLGLGVITPIGQLDVQGDEARIWTGAGSSNNALSSGELYVENDLEVDGTVYMASCSGAGCGGGATGWTDGGTNIYVTTLTDNVGIGTSSPDGKFGVWGNGTTTGVNTRWKDSAGTTKVTILDNGNVGIGTANPSTILGVVGGPVKIWTTAGTDTNATSSGELYVEGDLEVDGSIYGDGANITNLSGLGSGGWTDGGTNVSVTTTTDNVGIGVTSGTGRLDVRGDEVRIWTGSGSNAQALSSGELYVGADLEVDGTIYGALSGNALTATELLVNGTNCSTGSYARGVDTLGQAESCTAIVVAGWTDGGTNVILTTTTDNVGIGTTTPTGVLDVRGDEVRIWTGAGSSNNALASGELYVQGDLESDGTIYGGLNSNIQAGANTACNTTCTTGCAGFGFDDGTLGVTLPHLVSCSDATADECFCK